MQQQLQAALERITGLPLTKTTRHELVQYFHFGRAHYTTPQGLVLDVGKYTLAAACPWQLQQPGRESIKHSDVFLRRREAGLPAPKFDWKVPGANLRDQRLKELVNGSLLVAARVEMQEHDGFILHFADHSRLVVSPDAARPAPVYWQLFSNTGDGYRISAGPEV